VYGDALILTLDPVHVGGVATMQRTVVRAQRALGLAPHLAFLRSGRASRLDPRLRRGLHEGTPTLSAGYWPTLEYLNYALAAAVFRPVLPCFSVVHVVSGFHSPSLVPILNRRPFVSWVATAFRDEVEGRRRGGSASASLRLNHAALSVNELVEGWTYRHPRRVWALSSYTARRLREVHGLPGCRLDVQGAPVDTTVFRPDGPRWSRRERPYVLSVGRLDDERKNLRLLLQAFARKVAPVRESVDLVLAGPGADCSPLPGLARELGLADRVAFPGVLPEPELAAAYRSASAFVLPSHQEGLGLVVLEAQASGVACLATRSGGVEDLVQDGVTGLLVPQDDAVGLGRALLALLDDAGLAERLAAAGRSRAEREWSLAAFIARLERLYEDALAPPLPPRCRVDRPQTAD
jgi:glycosyltransferase involved in cell wall biosynthesis